MKKKSGRPRARAPERVSGERTIARRMRARDPRETHRAATPLELLFDLCFVVGVAQAAAHLHHGIVEAHVARALVGYLLVFFAIWWAWMNFTWFASAYDVDDVPYRLTALVQIAGCLVLAAGVPSAFEGRDFSLVTVGYAIVRVGAIANWVRAARGDAGGRRTATRYAIGLVACQLGWLALLLLPPERWIAGWLVMAPAELAVPLWAERAGVTNWHPHHIAERYGGFTLIVLGESVLAATVAIQSAVDEHALSAGALAFVAGGLLTLFSMWWLYFDEPAHRVLDSSRRAFVWGYGHYVVLAATAAVGAGLGVAADAAIGHAHVAPTAPGLAVAVPVAIYLVMVWALHVLTMHGNRVVRAAYPVATALVLAAGFAHEAVLFVGLILAALVAIVITAREKRAAEHAD